MYFCTVLFWHYNSKRKLDKHFSFWILFSSIESAFRGNEVSWEVLKRHPKKYFVRIGRKCDEIAFDSQAPISPVVYFFLAKNLHKSGEFIMCFTQGKRLTQWGGNDVTAFEG